MKIGINGLGRIGRLVLRETITNTNFNIVAANDLSELENISYLLKYDSAQCKFDENIEINKENNIIKIKNNSIKIFSEKNPENIPWKDYDVDIVIESTGFFNNLLDAQKHLKSGAKKVLITAPAGNDVKTIVYGVNDHLLSTNDDIISAASCTTNSLAPMAKILHDNFNILNGFMITIHSYTNDQNLLDSVHKDFRRGRSAAYNIVPSSTGAAKAIGMVIPELAGVLTGVAQRVPTISGSLTELIAVIEKETSIDELNLLMKKNRSESFGYNDDPIVSTDIIGSRYGSIFDATQTAVNIKNKTNMVKLSAWYDNELSYVSQLLRILKLWETKL